MATLSQAAGPKARSLPELEAAGVVRRDLPVGRAVRGGERGAQRAAPAQARQLAGALPGASHAARGLLRSRRPEADCWRARRATTRRPPRWCRSARRNSRGGRRAMKRMAYRLVDRASCLRGGISFGAQAPSRAGVLQGQAASADRRLRGRQRLRHRRALAGANICPGTCPASRPSSCRTCRRRPASWRPITSTYARRATAPCFASISRNLPSQAVMGQPNIEADPRRFNWLGATSFPGPGVRSRNQRRGEDRAGHFHARS